MTSDSLSKARARLVDARARRAFAEPTLYFEVQRAAVACLSSANAVQQIACAELDRIAERLGRAIEAEAMDQTNLDLWTEAIDRLVRLIDLSSSSVGAGEMAIQVANHRAFLNALS